MSAAPAPVSELTPVERPNGKLYRPRKAPTAQWTDNGDGVMGAVVHRTHDVDLAERLAREALNAFDSGEWVLGKPALAWGHFRPDRIYDWVWEESDGSTGYPSVFFTADLL